MSSPDAVARGRAKPAARKGGTKKAALPNDAGMTRQDKADFVKAIAEGLPSKGGADANSAAKAAAAPKVEVLRKYSAPTPARPANAESKQAIAFAALLEEKAAAGDFEVLTPEAFQNLMAALCKLYSANAEAGTKFPVVSGRAAISGTDAMIVCAALLRAVDLQVFELGMWQSWAGV